MAKRIGPVTDTCTVPVRELRGRSSSELRDSSVWGKIPASVARDLKLSPYARLVFVELCLWAARGNARVSRGQRAIAAATGFHQSTVRKGLLELAERGHLIISQRGRGRARYLLTSPVYRAKEVIGESAGEKVGYSVDARGTITKRLVQARPVESAKRASGAP